ncbi:ribosome small subunit-dependent GTPase A [Rhodoferax sp. UBA5149]|uniref:ribosome small subunit-dependent GTPase A n=1 Tax=Rhodoferax sp. UBA5149 TaxID=1947379 RepID=UPI0025D4D1CA|nr:ribosome small subunit-dependent GTPase A [Rhodoferax sp. UBA5149]
MPLEALGWNARWQEKFEAHGGEGLVPARVVAEHRSHYRIATEETELSAGATGRLRNTAGQRSDFPGVGDFVAVDLSERDSPATIEAVLPRTSALIRKASGKPDPQLLAANIDVVFIVTSMGGDFNLPRMKRYCALVQQSGAAPVILVNKSDLENNVVGSAGEIDGLGHDMPLHVISARVRESIQVLEQYFTGNRTVALIGSSGVGKSTLTNQLLGHDAQATQEVRDYDGRGRHTTTSRQLLVRSQGGAIIDTPGLRGLETWDAPEASEGAFDDIEGLAPQCRFHNCRHDTEPDCAVRSAVARGDLDAARLSDYIKQARGH